MKNILIKLQRDEELTRFLESNGFTVEELENNVFRVQREDELPVFINVDDKQIYFEVDLGNIDSIISQELLLALLALNTEILPVSAGIAFSTSTATTPAAIATTRVGSGSCGPPGSGADMLKVPRGRLSAARLATGARLSSGRCCARYAR
jgi:hypothetical protein